MLEINEQGSHGTSAENSPDKVRDEATLLNHSAAVALAATEDEKNFGFLTFDTNGLANSIGSIGKDN